MKHESAAKPLEKITAADLLLPKGDHRFKEAIELFNVGLFLLQLPVQPPEERMVVLSVPLIRAAVTAARAGLSYETMKMVRFLTNSTGRAVLVFTDPSSQTLCLRACSGRLFSRMHCFDGNLYLPPFYLSVHIEMVMAAGLAGVELGPERVVGQMPPELEDFWLSLDSVRVRR